MILKLRGPPVPALSVAMDKGINELGASYQYEHEELTINRPHRTDIRLHSGARYLEAGLHKNRTYELRKASSLVTRYEKACSVSAITKGDYNSPLRKAKYPEPRVPHKFVLGAIKPESTVLLTLNNLRRTAQPGDIVDGGETQPSQITILAGRREPVHGESRAAVAMKANDASALQPYEDFESTSGLYAGGHRRHDKIKAMTLTEKRREAAKKLKAAGSMGVYSNILSSSSK